MTFEDLLAEQGIQFRRAGEDKHSRNGWIQLECPFCGKGSGKFHLGYNLSQGNLSCWKCGHHTKAETLVHITGGSYKAVKTILSGLDRSRYAPKDIVKTGVLELPAGVEEMSDRHKTYLSNRNLDPDILTELWQVKGIGLASRLSWRIFIPIHYRGEVVSWTTRSISKKAEQRYISASEKQEALNHKELLFGEDMAKHAICVVEGPLDAMRIGPGAVATFGTAISRAQILKMSKYPVIGIALDSEKTAQQRARKLATELSAFGGDVRIIQLDAKDAGEASHKEIQQLRKELGL